MIPDDLLAGADRIVFFRSGPTPFDLCTEDDLVRAFALRYPPEEARRRAAREAELSLWRPAEEWQEETLLLVALLSAEHRRRVRRLLGWTRREIGARLARFREGLSARYAVTVPARGTSAIVPLLDVTLSPASAVMHHRLRASYERSELSRARNSRPCQ
jgi:hypothetical protein